MSKEEDKLLNSAYDGIQEYDNDLPRWWVWLFYGCIVFAIGYGFFYHLGGPGLSSSDHLAVHMKEIDDLRAKAVAKVQAQEVTEDSLLKLASDPTIVSTGKTVFTTRCAACHGQLGEGVVGPNLTDNFWIHGGEITQIHSIIEKGVIEKGMLAWKGQLPQSEIDAVTAYVWTLYGTNPANPKAPQGTEVTQKRHS